MPHVQIDKKTIVKYVPEKWRLAERGWLFWHRHNFQAGMTLEPTVQAQQTMMTQSFAWKKALILSCKPHAPLWWVGVCCFASFKNWLFFPPEWSQYPVKLQLMEVFPRSAKFQYVDRRYTANQVKELKINQEYGYVWNMFWCVTARSLWTHHLLLSWRGHYWEGVVSVVSHLCSVFSAVQIIKDPKVK